MIRDGLEMRPDRLIIDQRAVLAYPFPPPQMVFCLASVTSFGGMTVAKWSVLPAAFSLPGDA